MKRFEADTNDRVVVAIYPEMGATLPLEEYAAQLAISWKVGKGGAEDGAVLIVFVKDRKMYLHVSDDFVAVIPDSAAADILKTHIGPFFARGDFEGGVGSGVEAILRTIRASGASR